MKPILWPILWVGAVVLAASGCASSSTSTRAPAKPDRASQINLDLAIEHLRKGNLAASKEKLDRALEQNPRNAGAHSVAGLLYERLNESKRADTHYARAVALAPDNAEYKNNYAVFLCQQGRYARGEKLAAQAADNRLYKTPELAFYNAGNCARSAGNLTQAEKYFRSAVQMRPRFPEALLQLSEIEFEQQNFLSARGFLERYMEIGRTTPASLWLGVRIERGLGNAEVAQHYAQRLKSEYPNANQTKELVASERNPG